MNMTFVIALIFICFILGTLLYFALHTIRTLNDCHFRELVATRHQYIEVIDSYRAEVRSLTESLVRSEGRVYIHPASPESGPIDSDTKLEPSYSAFRMRPNPPLVRFKEKQG